MRALRLAALGMLAACGAARAQEAAAPTAEIISARPDDVSVTIYRDLFALITETRTVDLPAGAVTLSLDGVVETLLPQSVVLQQLDRALVERNHDFDRLSPATLMEKSVGGTVTLVRTSRKTGVATRLRAVVVSATDAGVVLRGEDGHEALYCSGLAERIEFERIPDGLRPTPRLSVRLAPGPAGRRTIRVSYLAHGFAWRSDYVARVAGNRMDLTGWLTLRNFTGASFREAQVQVIAGRLNLLSGEDGGTASELGEDAWDEEPDEPLDEDLSLLTGCYPLGPQAMLDGINASDIGAFPDANLAHSLHGISAIHSEDLSEVMVTGMRAAEREDLGDYQLYRLPWRTDLGGRQTKQASFLHEPAVRIERFYGFQFAIDEVDDEPLERPRAKVSFENRASSGLGAPLPEGIVRVFDAQPEGDVFAGESHMGDKAVGQPVELTYGYALDLMLTLEADEPDEEIDGVDVADVLVGIASAKPLPALLEIRLQLDDDMAGARIQRASHRTGRKHGDYAWRIAVPANGSEQLSFRLRVPEETPEGK